MAQLVGTLVFILEDCNYGRGTLLNLCHRGCSLLLDILKNWLKLCCFEVVWCACACVLTCAKTLLRIKFITD